MDEQELMQLHEYYQSVLDGLFTEDFKKSLIETEVHVFGEEHRKQFENNMKKIVVHPKFNLKANILYLKQKYLNSSITELEKLAIKKMQIESESKEAKEKEKKKKIEAQKQLLTELKAELSSEEAEQLQEIINNYEFTGEFHSYIEDQYDILFGDKKESTIDTTIMYKIIEKYHLDTFIQSTIYEEENKAIKKYNDTLRKIIINKYSNYEILNQLREQYEFHENLLKEYVEYEQGNYVENLKNKSTGQHEYHIFINPMRSERIIIGVLIHECLHAAQFIEKNIDGKICIKTGHRTFDENDTRYVLLSETLHALILDKEIFPYMREKGYDAYDTTYLNNAHKQGVELFYKTFRNQILRTACQEDIHELTDIVGLENWNELASIVESEKINKQPYIVAKMMQNAKEQLSKRIGKKTFSEQTNIAEKEKVSRELKDLLKEYEQSLTHTE